MTIAKYSDIDTLFETHPVNKDLVMRTDLSSIKMALKNLLTTNNYERFYDPDIGSNIRGLLFEQSSPLVSNLLSDTIRTAIDNYEPRVEIIDLFVSPSPDQYTYAITLRFAVKATGQQSDFSLDLERIH